MARPNPERRFTISLVLGLLLVPLSAVAAFAIVGSSGDADGATTTSVAAAPTTTAAATVQTEVLVEPTSASPDDLAAACGPDGMELVELEAAGTISDVQQAALDALRQVCENAETPLPGPPAPPPVVRTVEVTNPGTTSTTAGSSSHDDEYDDDEYDDEHEDDDHDDDDHEDDEHDDDDDDEHEDDD